VGGPVQITTGRRLANEPFPADVNMTVVLDGNCAFKGLAPEEIDIYWGAYLGMPDEILISGSLSERSEEIQRVRAEARERNGWIMDTYLLRKRRPPAA
jgi:precorrin-6A synthase